MIKKALFPVLIVLTLVLTVIWQILFAEKINFYIVSAVLLVISMSIAISLFA